MSLEVRQGDDLGPLTEEEEKEIITKLKDIRSKSEDGFRKARKRKERVIKAYECQHEDIILKRNGSKAYMAWIYTAHESAQARLTNSLVPNDDDSFALISETDDDQAGCDMMSDYIKQILNDMRFINLFDDAIKELLFGDVVIKLNWLKIANSITMQNPETMMPEKQEDVLYNNVNAEVISSNDFILWPLKGDMSRATCGHRVWRHKDELLSVQQERPDVYRNVEAIQEKDGNNYTQDGQSAQQGLQVWEYYVSRMKLATGRILRGYIMTVVEDQHLIRCQPNEYDYGLIPFIYCPLIKDYNKEGLQNTGHGLTDRAYEYQKMANFIINQVFDESKVKLYGQYKYVDDGTFNPGNFVSRPGGLIKVGDIGNLQPLNPNIGQLSFGIQELEYLESQFETTTGVPKFLTGTAPDNPNDTATSKRLQADGADTRFRALARRINENLLKPFIEMVYVLIRQYAIQDQTVLMDIARRTQRTRKTEMQPKIDPMTGQMAVDPETGMPELEEISIEMTPEEVMQSMPVIPPLSKIDVKVVGFENVLDKADKAAQFERFAQGIMQVASVAPEALDRVKMDQAIDHYARNLNIPDDLLRDESEMAELQMQKQQQAMQQQESNMKSLEMAARLGVDPSVVQQAMAA